MNNVNKNLFDELMGTPPPSAVDPGDIVRRELRMKAVRRTGMMAAVGLVAAGVVAGFAVAGGPSNGVPAPPGGENAGESFRLVADDQESAAATADRLRAALDAAVKREAPGATWTVGNPNQTMGSGEPPAIGYKAPDGTPKDLEMFSSGDSGIAFGERKGTLNLRIGRVNGLDFSCAVSERPQPTPPGPLIATDAKAAAGSTCRETRNASGAKIVVRTKSGSTWLQSYSVDVQLPDGQMLGLTHSNVFGPDGVAAQRDTPLTVEQVTAIAIDISGKIKA